MPWKRSFVEGPSIVRRIFSSAGIKSSGAAVLSLVSLAVVLPLPLGTSEIVLRLLTVLVPK